MKLTGLIWALLLVSAFAATEDVVAPRVNFWWETPLVYRPTSDLINARAWELELVGDYFDTSAYYGTDGNVEAMAPNDSFSRRQGEATLRYGFERQLEFRAAGRYRQNNSVHGAYATNSSGLESFLGGAKYAFAPVNNWHYALDAQVRRTAYSNQTYARGTTPADSMVLGDAGTEVTGGLHVSYRGSAFYYLSGSLSYNKPPAYLSAEALYHLEAAFLRLARESSWAFYFGIRGDLFS